MHKTVHCLSCYMNIPKYPKLFMQIVRETSFQETSCLEKWLSEKGLVRETSCPEKVCSGKWLSGKHPLPIVNRSAASVFVKTVVTVESSRVALQQIRGVEGSDYINASYIDVSLAQLIPYEHCSLQHYMHCVRCRSVLVQSRMDTCCLLNLWWIFSSLTW